MKRGIGPVDPQPGESEEEVLSDDIARVMLFVRGLDDSSACERASVATFRRNIHRCQLQSAGFVQHSDGESWVFPDEAVERPKVRKDEVIEVSWSQNACGLDEGLKRIALPSSPQLRKLVTSGVMDTMLYSHSEWRTAIQSATLEAVEAAVTIFRHCRPEFEGTVVLIGQGLGGAILFELVRAKRISFGPKVLCLLGSPLGAWLHLAAETILSPSFQLPPPTRLLNVIHPSDLMAYRFEPLLAAEFAEKSPEQIPSDPARIQKLMATCTVKGKTLALNGGVRIDWALRDDGRSAKESDEVSMALASHALYVSSADAATFIQAGSTSLAAWGTDGSLEDFLFSEAPWKAEPAPGTENGAAAIRRALGGLMEHVPTREEFRESAAHSARDLSESLCRKWEESGAAGKASDVAGVVSRRCKESGATDLVRGTVQAASGVVGTARAIGGTVRLVRSAVGAAQAAAKAAAAAQPR